MSNQRRVEESPYEVGFFRGVNQAVDELNLDSTLVPWLHGGQPSDRGNIRRIPGKIMASTGSLGGTVLTLTQFSFAVSIKPWTNSTWILPWCPGYTVDSLQIVETSDASPERSWPPRAR
jgi:hypothetical protein